MQGYRMSNRAGSNGKGVSLVAGYDSALDRCAVGEYLECLHESLTDQSNDENYEFRKTIFRPKSLTEWFRMPSDFRCSEIVHIQYPFEAWGNSPIPGLLAILIKYLWPSRKKIKVATTFHEWHSMHRLRKLSVLPLAYLSDMLVFVSKRELDTYLESFVGRHRRFGQVQKVIPIGVNLNIPAIDKSRVVAERLKITSDGFGGRKILLGFFGFIYDWKQPYKLIEVVRALIDHGVEAKLLICGDFPDGHDAERHRFWKTVADLDLESSIVHMGYVEDESLLAHVLAACDAHLCLYKDGVSSRRGSFWYSVSLGVKVICTAPANADEFYDLLDLEKLDQEGAVQFVSPDISVAELVEVVSSLPSFEVCGEAVAQPPEWSAIAARHHDAYDELLCDAARER